MGYFHLGSFRGFVGSFMGNEKYIYLRNLREAKQFGIKKIYSCMDRHKSEGGSMLENIWIQIKEEQKRSDIIVGLH